MAVEIDLIVAVYYICRFLDQACSFGTRLPHPSLSEQVGQSDQSRSKQFAALTSTQCGAEQLYRDLQAVHQQSREGINALVATSKNIIDSASATLPKATLQYIARKIAERASQQRKKSLQPRSTSRLSRLWHHRNRFAKR